MTNTNQTTQHLPFTPLNSSSQNTSNPVLYYNPNAPLEDIYECAITRINAVINLCEHFHISKTSIQAKAAFTCAATLLLSDAKILLEELNPIALQLRQEN